VAADWLRACRCILYLFSEWDGITCACAEPCAQSVDVKKWIESICCTTRNDYCLTRSKIILRIIYWCLSEKKNKGKSYDLEFLSKRLIEDKWLCNQTVIEKQVNSFIYEIVQIYSIWQVLMHVYQEQVNRKLAIKSLRAIQLYPVSTHGMLFKTFLFPEMKWNECFISCYKTDITFCRIVSHFFSLYINLSNSSGTLIELLFCTSSFHIAYDLQHEG
jgi:hypothetical protein